MNKQLLIRRLILLHRMGLATPAQRQQLEQERQEQEQLARERRNGERRWQERRLRDRRGTAHDPRKPQVAIR